MDNEDKAIRHDPAFKNLFLDFPTDTIRWLLPDAFDEYGAIQSVVPLRQEQQKRWLTDEGRELDVPLLCTFENCQLIVALIEHQHSKKAFSIYKLAHYTLDMMEANQPLSVVPVVVFADEAKWRTDVKRELENTAFGTTWFYFTFRKVKLKDYKAYEMLKADNPVLHILVANFDYPRIDRVKLLLDAYMKLFREVNRHLFLKYIDFPDKYGKLSDSERETILSELEEKEDGMTIKEMLMAEGRTEGRAEGHDEGQLLAKRDAIITILEARFGSLNRSLLNRINEVSSVGELNDLLRKAALITSVEELKV